MVEMEDDLRSEYDLKNLRVRKLGSGRKSFGENIGMELDELKNLVRAGQFAAIT